jgi:hypothetical protein
MVIAVSASREVAGAGNPRFLADRLAPPPANAVIAVSRPRYGLRFYWLAMPFNNRNHQAFNHFLADTSRDGNLMPTGGLLRPEFGNKPSIASPEGVPPRQAGCMDARKKHNRNARAGWIGPRL